jgi:hypothetical protein
MTTSCSPRRARRHAIDPKLDAIDPLLARIEAGPAVPCPERRREIVDRLALALVGRSNAYIARRAGVHRNTVARWWKMLGDFPEPEAKRLACCCRARKRPGKRAG